MTISDDTPSDVNLEARTAIRVEKRAEYGGVFESFHRIAKLWSAYLGVNISERQVAHMMILMKVSRDTIPKRDNLVDICGYAGCIEMLDNNKEAQDLTEFQESARQQQIRRRDSMLKEMDPNERT